jgi:Lhr-like helicase
LPIISKLAANPQPSVQAIYVGPLKALITWN